MKFKKFHHRIRELINTFFFKKMTMIKKSYKNLLTMLMKITSTTIYVIIIHIICPLALLNPCLEVIVLLSN